MSKGDYEKYAKTSRSYDLTRVPVGLDIIKECLSVSKSLSEINLIDIGCGTGIYGVELAPDVKTIHGVDISPEMIDKAKEKSRGISNIELYLGDALNLMFKNEKFDAALFNHVLHHISGNHSTQIEALKEAYRVLKPGGVIIIHTHSHEQLRDGTWFYGLISEAVERASERFIKIPDLEDILKKMGFEYGKERLSMDPLQGKAYWDIRGIFKKEWREGDSIWGLVTGDELKNAQRKVKEMTDNRTINKYFDKREKLREEIGHTMFVYAVKK